MSLWFFNPKERLDDFSEVAALGLSAGVGAEDILPHAESGPNSDTCPSTLFVRIAHLLYDPNLVCKQARALTGEPGPRSGHTES